MKIVRRSTAGLAAMAVAGGTMAAVAAPSQAAGTWDKLAQCESTGNWSINTGNGYYGGLQFSLQTWKAFGGSGMPHQASKAEQIRIATKVQATQGWGAWPACSAKLGLSGAPQGSTTPEPTVQKAAPKQTVKKAAPKAAEKTVAPERTSTKTQVQQAPAPQKTVKKAAKHVAPAPQGVVYNVDVTDSGKDYTVKAGDTLSKIAKKLGVDDWRALYKLNDGQLTDPDVIFVGQTLNVPTK